MPTAVLILMNSLRSAETIPLASYGRDEAAVDNGEGRPEEGELTLLAAIDKLHSVLQEVARHVEEGLDLVGHGEWWWYGRIKRSDRSMECGCGCGCARGSVRRS